MPVKRCEACGQGGQRVVAHAELVEDLHAPKGFRQLLKTAAGNKMPGMNGTWLRRSVVHFCWSAWQCFGQAFHERTEASDMECGRGVRHERSYRFRRLDGGVRMENVLHPAKAVAPMQACALHLRDRTPKARLAEVVNLPQPTIICLNRVPFMPGVMERVPSWFSEDQ